MPFSSIFKTNINCKEHDCKVNKKNIKIIYKPDDGFLDKNIERKIFPTGSYKVCDCIVICNDDSIHIVEILCGTLTYREFKEKTEQLKNCLKIVDHIGKKEQIKKIVLLHKRLEATRKNPTFRKKLLNIKC